MNLLHYLNSPDLARRLNRRAAVYSERQNDKRLIDAERREIDRQRQRERNEARKGKYALIDGEQVQ